MTKKQLAVLRNMEAVLNGQYENDSASELKEENETLISENASLEERLAAINVVKADAVLDCGIGKVRYQTPNNLQLQQLMEAFDSCVQLHGPAFMLQALQTIEKTKP